MKFPARFCPLAERVKLRTEHKQKKLRRFQTISFLVTVNKVTMLSIGSLSSLSSFIFIERNVVSFIIVATNH